MISTPHPATAPAATPAPLVPDAGHPLEPSAA